jgi:NAD+ diphosphatase
MNETPCFWFVFYNDRILMIQREGRYRIPCGPEPPTEVPVGSTIHAIGCLGDVECRTYALFTPIPGEDAPARLMTGLRASYDELPEEEYLMAGKAFQILNWDRNSRYCPACGVPTVQVSPIAKKCPECRQEYYPRISPAIIVRITRGDEILLVHARNFRGDYYGLVAGFLEVGETLEDCVRREVMEETGITITNLKYFASQPWPYPSGIMLGFTADYVSGEVHLQREELSKGRFFDRHHLPEIPKRLSLARVLIDDWLGECEV